jgi:aminodeoxychorismate synthase component I
MNSSNLPVPSCSYHHLEELTLRLPLWHYCAMYRGRAYSFLLDSAHDPERLGRYSFLGADPFLVYRAWRQPGKLPSAGARIQVARLRDNQGRLLAQPVVDEYCADVFNDLQALLDRCRVSRLAGRPVPFLAGAVGYFAYEAGRLIEQLPECAVNDLDLPTVYLALYDVVLAHDHAAGRSFLSAVGRGETEREARRRAETIRDVIRRRICDFEADPPKEWIGPSPGEPRVSPVAVRSHFDETGYCKVVESARQHILAGDVFEVCTTHRLESPFTGDPWILYQELRRINPAPFACYLHLPEVQVVGSSPERFLRLGPDRVAESRPIKGTRPRGGTPDEDARLRQGLACSEKDRAENLMIVDLVRNDLGRVCKLGSIHVPELLVVEDYATVFQLVSTIRGELDKGRSALDLVRACFPGGSMTGAPKIEAMKIIDRLEPVQRGIYSGSIGYLDFAGPMDLNIVIRTIVVKGGTAYYNVGGAVVADSDPGAEYQETLVKARALISALTTVSAHEDHHSR